MQQGFDEDLYQHVHEYATNAAFTEREKLAITALLASIVTLHIPVPEQAPDQLSNVKPGLATWVTFTTVPIG